MAIVGLKALISKARQATLCLAKRLGATDFVAQQLNAAARGFPEGPSRLQTAAYGQVAANLEAFGVSSLKEMAAVAMAYEALAII